MVYAYVSMGTVMEVERRIDGPYTAALTPLTEAALYHPSMISYFKPVPESLWETIRAGWIYSEKNGFTEPEPFAINPDTGAMYLPQNIKADDFYRMLMESIANANEASTLKGLLVDKDLELISLRNQLVDIDLRLLQSERSVTNG